MIEAILSGAVVGLALGLTGGGGSILAVPLLLGVSGLALRDAVAVSLAVVGLTALYGALLQRKQVRWAAGAVLGVGGISGAPLGALLGTKLPEALTLGLFAALMIFIAVKMWQGGQSQDIPLTMWTCRRDPEGQLRFHWDCAVKLVAAGALTGMLSGIFGVGGGFLVVPALLVVTAMPVKAALASSLVGIFLISSAAFTANLIARPSFPTEVAVWFFLGGVAGITVGSWGKNLLPAEMLRRVFAAALVVVAVWVGVRAWAVPKSEEPTTQIEFLQNEDLTAQGRQAAGALFRNLMGRLGEAQAAGGTVAAMQVCAAEAQELTGQTAEALAKQGIRSIRRIGVRTRNPQNRQDSVDEAMIRHFLAGWSAGSTTPPTGKLVHLQNTDEIRYYHPVPMAASCLACHGSPADIAPLTRSALAKLYPQDKAVGFAEGDLRGAVVVTFSPSSTQTQSFHE